MGQKHNRRRTRSRPRNRNHLSHATHSRLSSVDSKSGAFASPSTSQPDAPFTPVGRLSAHHWDTQYAAWQARARQHQHQPQHQYQQEEIEEDERLLRMFGGERGDETSLCGPMLQVVMDLFDGIDYEDP